MRAPIVSAKTSATRSCSRPSCRTPGSPTRADLSWLYDESPFGPAIQRGVDENGRRIAHYALIPQRYRGPSGVVPAAFSLNAVVRRGTQRQGWFRKLGPEIYEEAAAAGWLFSTGVCNEKSIGAVVKYMGWRTPGPLPVRMCPPVAFGRARGAVESVDVTPELLESTRFTSLTADLDDAPVRGWVNAHTPEYLRWRLVRPHGAYTLHVGDDLVGISTRDTRFGVRAAVILKLLPRGRPDATLDARSVVAAACRHHRAPYAVYAGFNAHVRVRGIRPPRRLQPSPLHLILRSLSPTIDHDTLALDTFELLDMDSY